MNDCYCVCSFWVHALLQSTLDRYAGCVHTGEMGNIENSKAEVTVYWRPGCPFCQRMRLSLRLRGLRPKMVNIWEDADGAAFVRSVADGNETVPTVVIDGVPHVNPAPRTVARAMRG